MRKEEFGTGSKEKADGKCQMADDEWQMADDECQVAEGELQLEAGGCDEGQSSEPMTEGCSGPVVGHGSNRVIDGSTNDKNGILSHEGAHAAGQPGQGDGAAQCLPDDVATPQKAPNKANLESKQIIELQRLKSETVEEDGQKQSQISQGETSGKPMSRDGQPAWQSGRRPVGSEAQGSELRRAAGEQWPVASGQWPLNAKGGK